MSLDITPVVTDNRLIITHYGEGTFTVNEHKVNGSILLYKDKFEPWPVSDVHGITLESLAPLLLHSADHDILLVGTGEKSFMPPKDIREAVKAKGLILEWMNTGAAARTYSALQIESRHVLAAIIAL